MQIIISVFLLVIGIAILTAPNLLFDNPITDGMQKMAAGWVGAVIGYWLS